MSHFSFNIGKLSPYEYCQSVLYFVGMVYQLTCSCSQKYIYWSDQTKFDYELERTSNLPEF